MSDLIVNRALVISRAKTPNHWLIGVRANERDASGSPRFIQQLQTRLSEERKSFKDTLIRNVTDPQTIHELRERHGDGYVGFYFVDEAILNAAKKAEVTLHPLELVFGPIEHAEVVATVMLPTEYWTNAETGAESRKRKRRRA